MLKYKVISRLVIILLVGLLIASFFMDVPVWSYFAVFFVGLFITILGSGLIRWNFHFTSLSSNRQIADNAIAITFDDGPNPEFTPQVLSLLKKYNAKATFFCIGEHIAKHAELFQQIIDEGHTVGNHTYSHANSFGFFGTDKVISELKKTTQIVEQISGLTMRMYRPAFGVTNPKIKKAVEVLSLVSIGWNKRSLDTTNRSENRVLNRITSNLSKGDVILLHDSSDKTLRVLERLLLFLQSNKIESVTVDRLLKIEPYA